MAEREWYPENWIDESCLPARSTPDDFIVAAGDGYQLGYKIGDQGVTEDEVETCNEALSIGDVVNFMCCDRLDDVEVTFRRDGSFTAHGEIPPEHNWCRLDGDQDTLQDSFADLAKAATGHSNDDWLDFINLFHDNADVERRITVQFARWSNRLPHKFIIKDGKPTFEQVSAASVNN